jgi:ChrB-like protein
VLQSEDGARPGWVLLLAQLPASPSGPRVTLWRRARAAGAAGLQNGAWVLPRTAGHEALFGRLAETVRGQGGSAFVLAVRAPDAGVDAEIAARFGADRAREYAEFAARADGLLAEIGKESRAGKFTFAELEEIEQDLDKLAGWLDKIGARDFFPGPERESAEETLQRCREAVAGFAGAVYAAEGLEAPGESSAGPRRAPDAAAADGDGPGAR